jgi:GDP-4-dehydro-6-deoxy-D-mannose reductase
MKKMLITGITGMIGSHLKVAAEKRGYEVCGIARDSAASRMAEGSDTHLFGCDILDFEALLTVFKKVKPDVVVHLAAQAFNGTSWQMEESTHQTNIFGTLNVLRATRQVVPEAKIMLACSSAEYGSFDAKDCPLTEDHHLRPITPYAVSKVMTEALGFQYFHNYGLNVFLPRLFIHVGTGHPPATAIQNFARQLALIKKGALKPVMKVGNLDSARDFIDVRDGVEALMLVLEKGKPGQPINICTGTAHSIKEVLDELIAISGTKAKIEFDKALMRPSDEPLLVGDNSKIKKLGWKQRYTLKQTLEAVFEDWLKRV